MILNFYKVSASQDEVAHEMNIPDDPSGGGATLSNQIESMKHFLGNAFTIVADENPLGQECITELIEGRVVKNGIFRHAQVIAGWKKTDQGVQYLIYDPLPKGQGSIKYQNPRVIYSINFVLIKK